MNWIVNTPTLNYSHAQDIPFNPGRPGYVQQRPPWHIVLFCHLQCRHGIGDGPGVEDEPIELQAAKTWSCQAQLQLKAQIDEVVEGWIGTGFGMIDDSKSKFLRVENVGSLKHMNLATCALIMSIGMINWLTNNFYLKSFLPSSTSLTNPFPKYCSFARWYQR